MYSENGFVEPLMMEAAGIERAAWQSHRLSVRWRKQSLLARHGRARSSRIRRESGRLVFPASRTASLVGAGRWRGDGRARVAQKLDALAASQSGAVLSPFWWGFATRASS